MMKVLCIFCCLVVFSANVFGQDLQTDLRKAFSQFSLVKINNQEALLKAKTGIPFRIQTNDRVFEFVLSENDLRSADFKAESTDKYGKKTEPRESIITTFKGKLTGQNGSIVRMFLDGQRIEGFISTQDRQNFFIEPAAKYSSSASGDDVVIYQVKDRINTPVINFGLDGHVAQFKNGVDRQAKAQFLKNSYASLSGFTLFNGAMQTSMKNIKVATDADTGFILANAGVSTTSMRIRSTLNIVDGIYERDLNLSILIGYAHYWKSTDPFGTATGDDLLYAFKNHWNDNFSQLSYPRNVAHLFSDNYTPPYGGGRGFIGTICNNPSFAYSVTYYYSSDTSHYASIVAHEIGHNLGGSHTSDEQGNQIRPGCENTLMQAQIAPGTSVFCQFSRDEIMNYPRAIPPDPNDPENLLCDATLTSP